MQDIQEPPEQKIPETTLGDKHFFKYIPDDAGRLKPCGRVSLSKLNHGTCVVITLSADWLQDDAHCDERERFKKQVLQAHGLGAKILLCVLEFTHEQIQKCLQDMAELFHLHGNGHSAQLFTLLPDARKVMEVQNNNCVTCLVMNGEIIIRTLGEKGPYLEPITDRLIKMHPILGTHLIAWSVQPNGTWDDKHTVPMTTIVDDETPIMLVGLNDSWLKSAQPQDLVRLGVCVQTLIDAHPLHVLPIMDPEHDPDALCRAIEIAGVTFRSHGIDESPKIFHMSDGLRQHMLGRRPIMHNMVMLLAADGEILSTINTLASAHNFAVTLSALTGD